MDGQGRAVMVDVTGKPETERRALAAGRIRVCREIFDRIRAGTVEKGNVEATARVAGIMAAKRTGELIPLCHSLSLTGCSLKFFFYEDALEIEARCEVKTSGKTGAEMEALTGVSLALLTVYDMCKAIDKQMEIGQIRLLEKDGGKSGAYRWEE